MFEMANLKYSNRCLIVKGPHPLDKNGGIKNLHFELGQATDEEQQKLRARNEAQHLERESAKRTVDEHLEGMHEKDEEHNAELHRENVDSDTYQRTVEKVQAEWRRKKEAEKRKREQGQDGDFSFSGDI